MTSAPPPPLDEENYNLWTIHVEDVDVEVREVWAQMMRYEGDAHVVGAFRLRPAKRVWVGPADLEFRDGRFHFPVEDYLGAAGRKFVARFDAQRYLSLSESIDLHRIDAAAVGVPCDLVAVSSDRLVPSADLRALAGELGAAARYHEIVSRYGHDAFLKETGRVSALVADALSRC